MREMYRRIASVVLAAVFLNMLLPMAAAVYATGEVYRSDLDSTAGTALPGTATATVYVGNLTGNNANDGMSRETAVKTMTVAYERLYEQMAEAGKAEDPDATGRIIVVEDVYFNNTTGPTPANMDSHVFTIVVSAISPELGLWMKNDYIHLGPTVYENITLAKASDSADHTLFRAEGYPLTIGENVTTVPNSGGYYFTVIGGNINGEYVGNSNLTIQSGTWRNIYAGCYQGTMIGNAVVNISGGTVDTTVSLTYNGTHRGNYDITIRGAEVNKVRGGSSMSAGSVTGDVSVTICDGAVVNGELLSGGASVVDGNILLRLTDATTRDIITAKCTGTANIELTASEGKILSIASGALKASRFTGGGTLSITNAVQLDLEEVTGMTQLQIDGSVYSYIPYITAPESTDDEAFSYTGKETLEVSSADGRKQWSFTGGVDPAELRIIAPEGVSVKLYEGFASTNEVAAVGVVATEEGCAYIFRGLSAGTYRCCASGSGWYSVVQNIYYSQEQSQTNSTIYMDPGKKAGDGFEQNSEIRLFTQGTSDRLFPSNIEQWPGYEDIFTTPAFEPGRAAHQQTTQQEMMDFLHSLDDPDDRMYVYILGTSPKRNYEIPIVVFTSVDLSGAETLEEAAELINQAEKTTIGYESLIHANEPASGEACLAMIQSLDGAYGDVVLESVNVYCIPRINPDGAYYFQRTNAAQSIDMNRDFLRTQSKEVELVHWAYNLFMPEVIISGHEYQDVISKESGVLDDVQIGVARSLNSDSVVNTMALEMLQNAFEAANSNGIRPFFYMGGGSYISTKNNTIGRTYCGLYGSLSFLIESNGLSIGMAWFERRVLSQYVVAESIIDYVVEHERAVRSEVARARAEIAEKGGVYGEEGDLLVLTQGSTNTPIYAPRPTWNLTDGTAKNPDAKGVIYDYDIALRTRTRPTAYVIPAGQTWTQKVLDMLDKHAARYYALEAGSSVLLQQYMGDENEAELTQEKTVIFESGAYVIPMDQVAGNVIAMILEPDVTDTAGYNGTLLQSGIVEPDADGMIPIYRYIHDLKDGAIETAAPHTHSYESLTVAPTSTEQGYTTHTCTVCGDSYVDSYVDGSWQKYDLASHMSELPQLLCSGVNLWPVLNREKLYFYGGTQWGTLDDVHSVTIPVTGGDRIAATSFAKGIRVTYFDDYGVLESVSNTDIKAEYARNGYITVPEGAVAANIPMWDNSNSNELYLLNYSHGKDNVTVVPPSCTQQGYTAYTCPICEESFREDLQDVLEHNFADGRCTLCGLESIRVGPEDIGFYQGGVDAATGTLNTSFTNNWYANIRIPEGAEQVRFLTFKTYGNWGSAFMNGSTYISGYSDTAAGGYWVTLDIPEEADVLRYGYLYDEIAQKNGYPLFEYVEFLGREMEPVPPSQYLERPATGCHAFTVEVNIAAAMGDPEGYVAGTDYGYIVLPTSYTSYGEPTRLIITCHGAGASLSTYQSDAKKTTNYTFWADLGYAVMDMYACPTELSGSDTCLHFGNPSVLECYKQGYEYVMEHFNLKQDGIYVIGSSMGGLSSFQIVQSGQFPVIAQVGYCPAIDLLKQAYNNPWTTPSYQRQRIAQYFDFEGTQPTFTNTKFPSAAEIVYFRENLDKVIAYSPILRNVVSGDLDTLFGVNPASAVGFDKAEAALYAQLTATHPCPVMIFHNLDDSTVSYRYSQYFTEMVNRSGQEAILYTFETGGHDAWTNGTNTTVQGLNGSISLKTSQYESYLFFQKFEDHAEHCPWVDPAVAPTCTQTGLTEGSHCAVCGEILTAQKEIPALGHTPGEAVKENEGEHGAHDLVIYCSVCGEELSREHDDGYVPGDINGDGEVNNKDLTRLFRYLSGYEAEVQEAALDVNGDGSVNNKDLTRLFRYLSGYEVEIN